MYSFRIIKIKNHKELTAHILLERVGRNKDIFGCFYTTKEDAVDHIHEIISSADDNAYIAYIQQGNSDIFPSSLMFEFAKYEWDKSNRWYIHEVCKPRI